MPWVLSGKSLGCRVDEPPWALWPLGPEVVSLQERGKAGSHTAETGLELTNKHKYQDNSVHLVPRGV